MRAALLRAVKIQSATTPELSRVELWRQLMFGPMWQTPQSAAVRAPRELEAAARQGPRGIGEVRLQVDDLREW